MNKIKGLLTCCSCWWEEKTEAKEENKESESERTSVGLGLHDGDGEICIFELFRGCVGVELLYREKKTSIIIDFEEYTRYFSTKSTSPF